MFYFFIFQFFFVFFLFLFFLQFSYLQTCLLFDLIYNKKQHLENTVMYSTRDYYKYYRNNTTGIRSTCTVSLKRTSQKVYQWRSKTIERQRHNGVLELCCDVNLIHMGAILASKWFVILSLIAMVIVLGLLAWVCLLPKAKNRA